MSLWRIAADTPLYEAHDLTGKGAELSGGRWNRPGIPMVYASISRALACLETLAHFAKVSLPLNRYLVEITVPEALWNAASCFDSDRGIGWDAEPYGKVSLEWGSEWARGADRAIAVVPSVIVPEEANVLLNPLHPDLALLRSRKVRRWMYDGRLRR